MEKIKISEQVIDFIKHVLPIESLDAILPITSESVYNLIDLLESGIEVPLTQREEADEPIDQDIRENAVRAIDELNREADSIDYEHLNRRLAEKPSFL